MILNLGLEYLRLKTVPLSRFIYNTLLESLLFEQKKITDNQQTNNNSDMIKKLSKNQFESIRTFVLVRYDMRELKHMSDSGKA